MKRFLLVPLVALVLILASCSRYTLVSSKVLNSADMTSYKSFSIQKLDEKSMPAGLELNDVKRICSALAQQLKLRGYDMVKSGGDLTLHVGLTVSNRVETTTNTDGFAMGVGVGVGVGVGPRGGWGGYSYVGAPTYVHGFYDSTSTSTSELVKNGVCAVDLVETESNKHVFCAQLSGDIQGDQLVLRDDSELIKACETLFKKFPIALPK